MKKITVVPPGATTAYDVEIGPGTTAEQVIEKIGLSPDQYVLTLGDNRPPLNPGQDVYKVVEDNQKIYLGTKAEAGDVSPASPIRFIGTRRLSGNVPRNAEPKTLYEKVLNYFRSPQEKQVLPLLVMLRIRELRLKTSSSATLPGHPPLFQLPVSFHTYI